MSGESGQGWLYEQYRDDPQPIDPKEAVRINRPFTWWGRIILIAFYGSLILAIWHFTARAEYWHRLGGIMFAYLMIKEILALCYRPYTKELTQDYRVSVLITCFNEDPASVVQVFENVAAQDYPVHEVLFLDDGSTDLTAFEVAQSWVAAHEGQPGMPQFKLIRFEENRGKRALLMDGIPHASGDYIFLLDSDSEILPNALTELLRPFEYKKTTSVVGNINVLNKGKFITYMQCLSYFAAFQKGRASQSVFGTVVVCSGAFSVHRKDFIVEHIEELKYAKLFGIKCSSGDDRSMTSLSKRVGGRTRYQATAYCETKVPETWRRFQKQRRRWQRSAYIGSLESIKKMFPRRPLYMFWAFSEAYLWLVALIIFVILVLQRGFYVDIVDVIIYFIIIAYKQSGFFLLYRPLRFVFAPIYFLAYGISLALTRAWAALTITNDDWGTRGGPKPTPAAPGRHLRA
ncbi:MAG: glycosyltransferase family 2 protein [Promicromonosporaceae bacterium]|nr:glycosyltransferase family 2 protein [Promicromonosporaceae bacterium]